MEFKDYYKIMGLEKTASDDDIRKTYRRLVRKYHPDISKEPDAQERTRDINEANDVLSNAEKRKAYDALYDRVKSGTGQGSSSGMGFEPPPGWNEGFTFQSGTYPGGEADFSDFFSSLFGSVRSRGNRAGGTGFKTRGEDQHANIQISLEEALTGTKKDITLRQLVSDDSGQMRLQPRTLRVKIPAGTHPGQLIRLNGQGNLGQGGGPHGDLYLEVHITAHPNYTIEGKDIYMALPLTPSEAALGTQLEVPLPGGQVIHLKIPPHTQNGSKIRMKDRGFPGTPAGHLYFHISVVLPPADTAAAKEAYEKLAKAAPFNPRSF